MKKVISLLLVLVMALSLCACGAAPAEPTQAPTSATQEQVAETLPAYLQKEDKDEAFTIFEYLKINYTDVLQRTVSLFGQERKEK